MALSPKAVVLIPCVSNAVFPEYETKLTANKCFLHISHLKTAACTYHPQTPVAKKVRGL
jgi:hypothetical protein